jgi:hypothetical protein
MQPETRRLAFRWHGGYSWKNNPGQPHDGNRYDDDEIWNNRLVHIGQGMIGHLFKTWQARWPTMPDQDFLPVLDGVRVNVGELLGPEQLRELWGWVCWEYEDHCQAKDRKARTRAGVMLQQCLPEWHQIASEAEPPQRERPRKKRKK